MLTQNFQHPCKLRDCQKLEAAAWKCSLKKVALKNFSKFRRKPLCLSFFFDKVAGWRLATLSNKAPAQVFPCEFFKISNNTYFEEHLRTTASKKRTTVSFYAFFSKTALCVNQRQILDNCCC